MNRYEAAEVLGLANGADLADAGRRWRERRERTRGSPGDGLHIPLRNRPHLLRPRAWLMAYA